MGCISCEIEMNLLTKHSSFLYWNKRFFLNENLLTARYFRIHEAVPTFLPWQGKRQLLMQYHEFLKILRG